MTTGELMRRLRTHYVRATEMYPGGFLAEEVGNNNTFAGGRRVDAVYVGFTSASGRIMVGHELKTSRADWHHELEQLHKADQWADACHAFYVVAPDTTIVEPESVPARWGLMVPDPKRPTKMKVIVKAEVKLDHNPPWEAVRSVMARQDTMRASQVSRLVDHKILAAQDEAVDRHVRTQLRSVGEDMGTLSHEDQQLLRTARAFRDGGVPLRIYRRLEDTAVVTPEMLTPSVLEILSACRDIEDMRERLAGRYSDVPRIAQMASDLAEAVAKLGAE